MLTSTVIGIPHPKKVQVAKAFIVLNDGLKPTKEIENSIKKHCEKNLAKYSLPAEYEFRDSLPKTLVGKVAYTKLEQNLKEEVKEAQEEPKLTERQLRKIKRLEEKAKKIIGKITKIGRE